MSIIAVTASTVVLVLGAISMVRDAGYEFDLRRKPNRRLLGGRRAHDRASSRG